jgi:hypothetical protein
MAFHISDIEEDESVYAVTRRPLQGGERRGARKGLKIEVKDVAPPKTIAHHATTQLLPAASRLPPSPPSFAS